MSSSRHLLVKLSHGSSDASKLSPAWWHELDVVTRQKLYKGIAAGDIWLTKVRYNEKLERIYGNVCLEVLLPSRGTCLLQHISLGACKIETLSEAFVQGMSELCELHGKTGVGETGEYLSLKLIDKLDSAFLDGEPPTTIWSFL